MAEEKMDRFGANGGMEDSIIDDASLEQVAGGIGPAGKGLYYFYQPDSQEQEDPNNPDKKVIVKGYRITPRDMETGGLQSTFFVAQADWAKFKRDHYQGKFYKGDAAPRTTPQGQGQGQE